MNAVRIFFIGKPFFCRGPGLIHPVFFVKNYSCLVTSQLLRPHPDSCQIFTIANHNPQRKVRQSAFCRKSDHKFDASLMDRAIIVTYNKKNRSFRRGNA
ncbi:hypothetical protein HMPREF1548_03299 [Clostridium sp. KLE 1755]|nr:hypothetical protein HMPREF1548_03299 [Clostridium sp. KLE 1755]